MQVNTDLTQQNKDNLKNNSIKISVIIPVYNVEKYLAKCLDSVLNQTLKEIEVICINDGSTDNSLEILEEYSKKDSRLKIISQENQGISVARNAGFDISNGEYVAFIDSDDWLDNKDYYEKMYYGVKNNDADIAVSGIIRGNERYKVKILEYAQEITTDDYYKKLEICDIPDSCFVWNKIYKKDKLSEIGLRFTPGLIYEDIIFTPKVLYYLGKLVTIPDVKYFYYRHSNTIVKNSNKKAKQDHAYAQEQMYNFFKEINIDISQRKTTITKFKILGLTIFKIIKKNNIKKFVLLNFIKWESRK